MYNMAKNLIYYFVVSKNKSMAKFILGDNDQTACNLNVIIYMGDNYGKQY